MWNIKYIDEYDDILLAQSVDYPAIPGIGQKVQLDDTYKVNDVVWDIRISTVFVFLSQTLNQQKEVAESTKDRVEYKDINAVNAKADRALKEAASIKRQVANMKQHIENLTNKR